jgi:hypothetical protein
MRGLKYTAGFIFISFMCLSFFGNGQKDSTNYYMIRYDQINDSVPDSTAVITGNIIGLKTPNPIQHIAFQRHDEPGIDFKTAYIDYAQKKFYFRMPPQKGVFYAVTITGKEIVLPVKEYKSQSWTKIDFYSSDTVIVSEPYDPVIEMPEPQPSFKPVIYLYNQDKIDVSLKLKYKGDLTFTYPKYKDGWNVSVDKNGINSSGKTYPYLFWEGEMFGLKFKRDDMNQIPARKVKRENIISVLEGELKGLGLNETEMTDFITFWAPKMEKYEQVAIQFLRNKEYSDKVATLNVSPAPKTMNRIYLLYTPITKENESQFVEIQTNYEKFVRKGFTLVEWGGSELSYVKVLASGKVRKKGKNEQVPGTVMNATMEINPTKSR